MAWFKIKDLKDLQAILDVMAKNDLVELEVEAEGQRVRLRRAEPASGGGIVFAAPPFLEGAAAGAQRAALAAGSAVGTASGESASSAAAADDRLEIVPSPLVGTFYRAPSPEADPFVELGDRVDEDSVLCIVEAMKVMNEIRSGKSGVVREILVKNGESVEYGQPLFRLEP